MAVKTESTAAVEKKAKAYKKMLEHCEVNPHFCLENGEAYYRVTYQRNQHIKGSAVLSAGECEDADAKKAFPVLVLFHSLIESIQESVNDQTGIPVEVFSDPLDLITIHKHADMTEAKQVIEHLYHLHLTFSEQHKRFKSFIAEPHQIFDEDVEILEEYAASFELLRYHRLKSICENTDVISQWIDNMKNLQAWSKLTDLHHGYYKKLVNEREENLKLLNMMDTNPADSEEDQLHSMMQKVAANSRQVLEDERQRLRWPEF